MAYVLIPSDAPIGGGGGGGGDSVLTEVERKGPLTVAATSQTFSGLLGNSDGGYYMTALLKGAVSTAQLAPRINGAALTAAARIHTNAAAVGTDANTQFRLLSTGQSSVVLWLPVARTGIRRHMHIMALSAATGIDFGYTLHYVWDNSATEITSIGLVSDTVDSIGIGSELVLYKLAS